MAVGKFIFFLLTALVAVNLIFAESEQHPHAGNPQGPPPQGSPPPQGGPPPQGSPPPQGGPPPQDGPNQEPNGRFFGRFAGCNYTATPGATCLNCITASTCLSSNVGIVRVCHGLLPFCNSGRCSFIPPANCTFG